MFHKKDIEKDRIYQNTIDYILKAQGDLFQAGSTLTGYVPRQLIEKVFSKIEYNKERPICIYSDYGEWVDFLIEKYGYDVNFRLVPSSLFGYEMSIHSLERYTENPADFVIFNREKYESIAMIDKYFDDIMKEAGMIYQIMTGNPPYGMRIKGSSADLHLKIMENSLNFCSDKLCFIMPSKPIFQQLPEYWYKVFTTSVCTNIETVDKSLFPGTIMEDVAIYHIDRNASSNDYDRQLDVDDKIYNAIDEEGKLFMDKMSKFEPLKLFTTFTTYADKVSEESKINNTIKKMDSFMFYLNTNRANGAYGAKIISGKLEGIGVLTKDEETEFIKSHIGEKNLIQCPTKEYGENLEYLMTKGRVLRYALWIMQTNQHIYQAQYKYIPDVKYEEIHSDEELLKVCGFSDEEVNRVMIYLNDFDFSRNRNKEVRKIEVKSSYVNPEEETDDDKLKQYLLDREFSNVIDET